jgi:hypothetical protein
MHTAVAVSHAGRTNVFDPSLDSGLVVPTGLVVVGGGINFENPAGPPDRDIPLATHPVDQLALASRP